MVHIMDKDVLQKIASVEGEFWKEEQQYKDNEYSLKGAQAHFLDCQQRNFVDSGHVVATIYGYGGYNRYFVYGDGQVKFSERHAMTDDVIRATEEGFSVHR